MDLAIEVMTACRNSRSSCRLLVEMMGIGRGELISMEAVLRPCLRVGARVGAKKKKRDMIRLE